MKFLFCHNLPHFYIYAALQCKNTYISPIYMASEPIKTFFSFKGKTIFKNMPFLKTM